MSESSRGKMREAYLWVGTSDHAGSVVNSLLCVEGSLEVLAAVPRRGGMGERTVFPVKPWTSTFVSLSKECQLLEHGIVCSVQLTDEDVLDAVFIAGPHCGGSREPPSLGRAGSGTERVGEHCGGSAFHQRISAHLSSLVAAVYGYVEVGKVCIGRKGSLLALTE